MSNVIYSDIVYKVPGPHAAHNGKTYDYCAVKSKEEHTQKLKEGWSDSLVEAVEGKADPVKIVDPVENTGSPTRDEAKEKATELGISFPKNISTVKLIALIEEKLKED